jgi:hypothetical protein
MKTPSFAHMGWIVLGIAFAAGCSSASKKFEDVTPGMTSDQVRHTMSDGPSRFENLADSGYSSWYWGDDYCVLFKDDKVVAKDAAREGNSSSAKGVEYKETRKASCVAPGQTAKSSSDRSVNIPGVGTIHLPGGSS